MVEEHYRSLCEAAVFFGFEAPPDFRESASFLPPVDGRWRWVHSPSESKALFQEEKFSYPSTFSLSLAPQRVGSENWDARYKTFSYLTHWQAKQAVATDEALLLNEHDQVATAAMSNLFWATKGQLFTPAFEVGCRRGVTRQWIMQQLPVIEVRTSMETLAKADELFLTSSLIGIKPVTSLAGLPLPVGNITQDLLAHYNEHLEHEPTELEQVAPIR
jgi:4-amino-4-deoxychorismate lyase